MKYSIEGNTFIEDESEIISVINKYRLWRLVSSDSINITTKNISFEFEAWVNTEDDKANLFNELKIFIDNYGGWLRWHECTHDEKEQKPCVIIEEYRG
jgi:hypothetical protein